MITVKEIYLQYMITLCFTQAYLLQQMHGRFKFEWILIVYQLEKDHTESDSNDRSYLRFLHYTNAWKKYQIKVW